MFQHQIRRRKKNSIAPATESGLRNSAAKTEGHRSGFAPEKVVPRHKLYLSDLLSAGCVAARGQLVPRRKKHAASVATLLSDGRLDIGGTIYASPSEAAQAVTGTATNGWWFFLVDPQSRRSLRDVRTEYLESIAADDEDDEPDDMDDDT